jgi:tetratricopeptide (TPR) repeat protein
MASVSKKRRKSEKSMHNGSSRIPVTSAVTADFPRGGGTTLTPFEHRQALREVSAETRAWQRPGAGKDDDLFADLNTLKAKSGASRSRGDLAITGTRDEKNSRRDLINSAKRRRLPAAIERSSVDDIAVLSRDSIAIGVRMLCSISAILPISLILTLPDNLTGHVPITNISEQLTEQLERKPHSTSNSTPSLNEMFSIGQQVVATVVGVHTINGRRQKRQQESQRIELSLVPRLVNDGIGVNDLCSNYVLPMAVVSAEDNGYLVSIGLDTVTGFVAYSETPRLAIGQIVRGSIMTVSESKRTFTASLQPRKILKNSITEAPCSTALLPGLNIKALVMEKLGSGLQLKLFGLFDVTASTAYLPANKSLDIGQRIQVHILWDESQTYEPAQNRIAVSLLQLPENAVGHLANVSTDTTEPSEKRIALAKDDGALELEDASWRTKPSMSRPTLEDDTDHRAGADISTLNAPLLSLGSTLAWNSVEESHSEASTAAPSKHSITTGRSKNVRQAQDDLTDSLAEKRPSSAVEFERLLLGSPNSSFIWIQLMSFYVQLGDVNKARQTAKQALRQIHYREDEEKLNVWVALMNLENTYGTDEELDVVFRDACAFNDALLISLRLAQIFEDSHKTDAALEHWKKTAKKFGHSVDVWAAYHRCILRATTTGDIVEPASSVVGRSMQSLDKSKHVNAVSAFAINEFKFGDPEIGRTMFEGLVDTYPKRLDIWLQYVDQEMRFDQTPQVRSIFERMLAGKMSSKKVRSILRKWLDYEKKIGDHDTQNRVLQLAREYVERGCKIAADDG